MKYRWKLEIIAEVLLFSQNDYITRRYLYFNKQYSDSTEIIQTEPIFSLTPVEMNKLTSESSIQP